MQVWADSPDADDGPQSPDPGARSKWEDLLISLEKDW